MDYRQIERILTIAKHEIGEPHKWCQGQKYGYYSMCTLGALEMACIDIMRSSYVDYEVACINIIQKSYVDYELTRDVFEQANGINHIARWNDAQERTHIQIMEAFDRAIAYCQVRQERIEPLPSLRECLRESPEFEI